MLVAAAEWVEHPKLETATLTTFTKLSVATQMISEQNVASINSDTFWICGGFLKWGYPQIIRLSGILGFSMIIINHPFWGTPVLGNPHERAMQLILSQYWKLCPWMFSWNTTFVSYLRLKSWDSRIFLAYGVSHHVCWCCSYTFVSIPVCHTFQTYHISDISMPFGDS